MSAAESTRVYAPESASSADGLTRSMCAMALFNAAKEDYAKLDATTTDADRAKVHRKHAAEALQFAIDNGGIYIKAAQFVASLQGGAGQAGVPSEYVDAFKPLTDRVPPRHYELVAPVAEAEFGQPLGELVDSIDEWPVAAASLAQVHCAYLRDKDQADAPPRKVAVKLQYPTLQEQMAADFETLKMMASMIAPNGYDFNWIIEDIEKYVTSELDFTREAYNARAASDALTPLAPAVMVRARARARLFAARFLAQNCAPDLRGRSPPRQSAPPPALCRACFARLALAQSPGGFWWLLVASGGFWWLLVASGGFCWLLMDSDGSDGFCLRLRVAACF